MDIIVSVSIISAAVAAWVAVVEYGVKVVAENRLQKSAASEIDTRMSKLFVELMWLAEARAGSQVSERCVEVLFEKGVITDKDFGGGEEEAKQLKKKLEKAVINLPVGQASQNAAIVSLAILGGRYYKILGKPAREALNGLKAFKGPEAEKGLTLLDEEERRARAAWGVRVVRDIVHCMVRDRS